MGYNSPYSKISIPEFGAQWVDLDIEVKYGAVPTLQDAFKSLEDGREICAACFYGIHAHAPREKDGRITSDSQDCKNLLRDRYTGETVGQCCCTWHLGDKS